MFPLDFPLGILGAADRGQWVLDPFCGRGTTLFAARRVGLGGVGIDTSAVAVAIARAKVARIDAGSVKGLASDLFDRPVRPNEIPSGDFWRNLYHPDTLHEICVVREQLLDRGNDAATVALRAVVLGILHGPLRKGEPTYLSNQMPRTYATKPAAAVSYWKRHNLKPPRVHVLEAIKRRIDFTLSVVPPMPVPGDVHHGDARIVLGRLRRKFNWVITSPPYYGMNTYIADQWIRNWFLGDPPSVRYGAGNQIAKGDRESFTDALSDVWSSVATRCHPGASLAIRFGALPSAEVDPEAMLRRSLNDADAGWRIKEVRDAGQPNRRARQAIQFKRAGSYAPEIDCVATLK